MNALVKSDCGRRFGGVALVCCIARASDLKNQAWVDGFRLSFDRSVAAIAAAWPVPGRWVGPFNYQLEMEGPLSNIVFVLEGTVLLKEIVALKRRSMALEESYRVRGRRSVNINPALLAAEGLMLASHKSSQGRFQIADDVFIELQQVLTEDGRLLPLSNAFSEYTSRERQRLLETLVNERGPFPLIGVPQEFRRVA